MPWWHAVLIVVSGFGAGVVNTVVGGGTLVTFPTLVALGSPPVTATITDSVGLLAGKFSGVWGYRRELDGQWTRLRRQLPAAAVGAVVGAVLLLNVPQETFESIAPVILVAALLLVAFGPVVKKWAARRAERGGRSVSTESTGRLRALAAATFVIAVVGGYFAAAESILLIGAIGALTAETLQRINAAKNAVSLVVNVVAALSYVVLSLHQIDWASVGLIALGALAGGWFGARRGRRLSPTALRVIVIVVGVLGLVRLLTL